jgi:hypothetical protein
MLRSSSHLAFVRRLPCLGCGVPPQDAPIQAAHLRFRGGDGGMGLKPSDNQVVPLCATCHHIQHTKGEPAFWAAAPVRDPHAIAHALYQNSGNEAAAYSLLFEERFYG